MKWDRFFRVVQRVNAIILLLIGIALLIAIGAIAADQIESVRLRNAQAPQTDFPSETSSDAAPVWHLSAFEPIATNTLQAEVRLEDDYTSGSSFDKGRNLNTVNYIFFDTDTRNGRWLLPHNRYVFNAADPISETALNAAKESGRPVYGMYYLFTAADSDGDGAITGDDLKTVAVSDIDGDHFNEIIPKIDHVLGTHFTAPDALVVIYTSQGQYLASEISVSKRTVTATRELPKPPTP